MNGMVGPNLSRLDSSDVHVGRLTDAQVIPYFPLVHWVVRQLGFKPEYRHRQSGLEYDDGFQAGCIGLLRALKKYNPKKPWREGKECSFKSYAAQCIRWEIMDELDRAQWMRPRTEIDPQIVFGWDEFTHHGQKMDIDVMSSLRRARLTEQEDLVLEMSCVHGIHIDHIGRLMGLKKSKVYALLREAKGKITEALH